MPFYIGPLADRFFNGLQEEQQIIGNWNLTFFFHKIT